MSCGCKKQNCGCSILLSKRPNQKQSTTNLELTNDIILQCEIEHRIIQEELARAEEDEKEEQFDMLCMGVGAIIALILSCAGAIIIST